MSGILAFRWRRRLSQVIQTRKEMSYCVECSQHLPNTPKPTQASGGNQSICSAAVHLSSLWFKYLPSSSTTCSNVPFTDPVLPTKDQCLLSQPSRVSFASLSQSRDPLGSQTFPRRLVFFIKNMLLRPISSLDSSKSLVHLYILLPLCPFAYFLPSSPPLHKSLF